MLVCGMAPVIPAGTVIPLLKDTLEKTPFLERAQVFTVNAFVCMYVCIFIQIHSNVQH